MEESHSIAADENLPVRRIQCLFNYLYEYELRFMVWHFEMTHLVQQHPLIDRSHVSQLLGNEDMWNIYGVSSRPRIGHRIIGFRKQPDRLLGSSLFSINVA